MAWLGSLLLIVLRDMVLAVRFRCEIFSIGSTVLWLGLLKRWIRMPCTDLMEESGTWKLTFPSFPKR